jgi:hypothetical protein
MVAQETPALSDSDRAVDGFDPGGKLDGGIKESERTWTLISR